MNRLIALIATLLIGSAAFAQQGTRPQLSSPDPFYFAPLVTLGPDIQHLDGLTPANPVTVAARSNVKVLILFGGSMVSNSVNGVYTATNTTHLFSLVVQNGGLYTGLDPARGVLWNTGADNTPNPAGCMGLSLADHLITDGWASDIVVISIGWNSMLVADYAAGGQFNLRLTSIIRRATALGLPVTHILFEGGSNDATAGTSAASYEASMASIITTARNAGFSGPFIIQQQTYSAGTTNSTIQAAQAASATGLNVFLSGFNSDSLGNSFRQSDQTHFNFATGEPTWVSDTKTQVELH